MTHLEVILWSCWTSGVVAAVAVAMMRKLDRADPGNRAPAWRALYSVLLWPLVVLYLLARLIPEAWGAIAKRGR